MPAFVRAQWVKIPTAGIPRTADGSPDMTAPAPKGRDGTPDLSGAWMAEKTMPCPPNGCDDMMIGVSIPGDRLARARRAAVSAVGGGARKEADRRFRQDDPQARCLPTGIVRMHRNRWANDRETPGLIVILNERNASDQPIL